MLKQSTLISDQFTLLELKKKKMFSDAVKDRILQIEENKLRIMKERLSIEKKKLSVLEDYIAWCKNQATTPSVSPVIKGLIEF